jgi:PH-interacting protein
METAFCLASCRGHEVSLLIAMQHFKYSQPFTKLHRFQIKGDITDLAVSSNNAVVASSANDFVIRVVR